MKKAATACTYSSLGAARRAVSCGRHAPGLTIPLWPARHGRHRSKDDSWQNPGRVLYTGGNFIQRLRANRTAFVTASLAPFGGSTFIQHRGLRSSIANLAVRGQLIDPGYHHDPARPLREGP